jgi:enoyl-CoA hydratase/carnithine racemase
MTDGIRVQDSPLVRRITIDRPKKKNAMTIAMYAALDAALNEAARDDGISVVAIDGEGDAFSAGNDIGDFMNASTHGAEGARPATAFLQTISTFEKPVVASVQGVAIGVGATMLLHCDLVIAATGATFQFPFTKLRLVPEAASTILLPARVGLQRASEWLLLGERIDAQAALQAGLVNAVVPPEALADATSTRVQALARLPLGALKETKRLMREPLRAAVADAMVRELQAFAMRLASPEAAAAFQAFLTRGK